MQHGKAVRGFGAWQGLLVLGLVAACGDDDGGDGGGGGSDCQSVCDISADCPNDPRENCVSDCQTLAALCPDESDAALSCTLARPMSDFVCDEDDGTTILADGVCEAESTALIACALGGGG